MASLTYNNPPGVKAYAADENYYSQTVDLGNGVVKASGQGGWSPDEGPGGPMPEGAREQIDAAFVNIDTVLKAAGLRGADDVFLVRAYTTDMDEGLPLMWDALRKWIPSHRPVYTIVGTTRLGLPEMKIEVEVEAKRKSAG